MLSFLITPIRSYSIIRNVIRKSFTRVEIILLGLRRSAFIPYRKGRGFLPPFYKQKEIARKNWTKESNPNYKEVDTEKLINLVAQGKSLGEISSKFPLTKQGIRYKILTTLNVKTYADAKGAAIKWLSSELPAK